MNKVTVISSKFNEAKNLVIKFLRLGKSDIQTSTEITPYGLDSNPIKDMVAIYSETTEKGGTIIIGYINKNRLADPGEYRTFATDANGTQKFYTWMKADGTMEIGGVTHNMIRYLPLNTALQGEVTALNAEFVKIAAAINALLPGAYTPAPISLDISASKINEIKTL